MAATPTFDIANHPFLPSNPPSGEDLNIISLVAEYQLGIHGVSVEDNGLEIGRSAVAMQVAFLLSGGLEPRKWAEHRNSSRTRIPTEAAKAGIDPAAQGLADKLKTGSKSTGVTTGGWKVATHL